MRALYYLCLYIADGRGFEAAKFSLKNECFGQVVLCCCCCLAFLSISSKIVHSILQCYCIYHLMKDIMVTFH